MNKEKLIKIAIVLCFVSAGLAFVIGFNNEDESKTYYLATAGLISNEAVGSSDAENSDGASSEGESGTSSQAETSDGLVNINTADEAELKTLKGIGTVRAQAIIEYRNKNGPFAKKTDIMKVSGIKEASYEKIKDSIKVE